jgi:hypothetical protein
MVASSSPQQQPLPPAHRDHNLRRLPPDDVTFYLTDDNQLVRIPGS